MCRDHVIEKMSKGHVFGQVSFSEESSKMEEKQVLLTVKATFRADPLGTSTEGLEEIVRALLKMHRDA